jgi:hypothetical protein
VTDAGRLRANPFGFPGQRFWAGPDIASHVRLGVEGVTGAVKFHGRRMRSHSPGSMKRRASACRCWPRIPADDADRSGKGQQLPPDRALVNLPDEPRLRNSVRIRVAAKGVPPPGTLHRRRSYGAWNPSPLRSGVCNRRPAERQAIPITLDEALADPSVCPAQGGRWCRPRCCASRCRLPCLLRLSAEKCGAEIAAAGGAPRCLG